MASKAPIKARGERCGPHAAFRSKAEALAAASWHLTCHKCRAGLVMDVWLCRPRLQHWHRGHRPLQPGEVSGGGG